MTLERRTVSVPIGVGQSEADAAPYIQGNAASVNVAFSKRGLASKRPPVEEFAGADAATNAVVPHASVPWTVGVDGAYRFDPVLETADRQSKSEPRASSARVTTALRGRRYSVNPTCAILQNVMVVMWSDYAEGAITVSRSAVGLPIDSTAVYYAFFDVSESKSVLLSGPTRCETLLRSARVVALETGDATRCFIAIGEQSDTEMGWERYVVAGADYTFAAGGSFPLGADRSAVNDGYDVCATDPDVGSTKYAWSCWPTSMGGGGTYVSRISANNTRTSVNITTAGRTEGKAIFHHPVSDRVYVAQLDGVYFGLDSSLSGVTAGFSGTTTLTPGLAARRCAMGCTGSGDNLVVAWSERRVDPDVGLLSTPVAWGTHVTRVGSSVSDFYVPNLCVVGRPIRHGLPSQTTSLFFAWQGFAQHRVFVASIDDLSNSLVSASALRIAAHGAFSESAFCEANVINTNVETNSLISIVADGDGDLHTVYPVFTELDYTQTSDLWVTAIQLDHARLRADVIPPVRQTRANDVAMFAGGAGLACIDGRMCAENTPMRPDRPGLTGDLADASQAPYADADEYTVKVAWGWIDASGREHRSALSEGFTTAADNFASGGGSDPLLWLAPYPNITAVDGDAKTKLFLDVYLSMPNDASIMRRVGRLWNPDTLSTAPDGRVFYFLRSGGTSSITYLNAECSFSVDVSATDFPEPYTDTELEAEAPGALVDVVSTQQRLWALSSESRFAVLVSKPLAAGYAPEFNSTLSIDVPQEGGDCVALAALDDKIVVFKQDRIYVIVGDPGDANGSRSTVQRPRLLSSDVGCTIAASVVEGPFGVAFMSSRGIMLLSRGLELSPIGERVEDTTANTMGVGVLVPASREVRWYLAEREGAYPWVLSGDAVVWRYDVDAWSVWNACVEQHQIVIGDEVYGVGTGYLNRESSTWTLASHTASVTTPWIAVNGVEGFQRVWRATFLLYYYTADVRVTIAYDYDPSVTEDHDFTEAVMTALAAPDGRCEISVKPQRQKCSAIRLTIAEQPQGQSPPYTTIGQGISVVSVDLELGVKSGTARRRLAAEAKR